MIIQVGNGIAVNTNWVEFIERGGNVGETWVTLRGGRYTEKLTILLSFDEVVKLLEGV